jgi:HEAT repeat protein
MSKILLTVGFVAAGLVAAWAGDDKEVDEAIVRFKKGMANPSAPARASAVTDLAGTKSEQTAKMLGGLLVSDTEPVRKAAAAGLAGFIDYKKIVTPMLLNGLNVNYNQKESKVVEAICQALGKLDDDLALPALHRYFEDKDAVVASAALQGAAEIRHVSSIDLIIDLMKKYDKIIENSKNGGGGGGYGGVNVPGGGGSDPKSTLAKAVMPSLIKAMQHISGDKWTTVKEWELWWSKRKATFKIDK